MVEFKVKFNNRIAEKLSIYQINKTSKNVKKLSITFILVGVFLIAYGLFNKLGSTFDYVVFGIGVFSVVFWLLFPKVLKKTIIRNQQKMNENSTLVGDQTEEIYRFDNDKVYIFTTRGTKYRAAIETDYDYFYSVFEDDDCYLLFISNMQCHVLFKDCLQKGTLEEFDEILKSHFFGDKFTKNLTSSETSIKPENDKNSDKN